MAKLKPFSATVCLWYKCSSCEHRHKVDLVLGEEMILLCPKCENLDYAVPATDFRVVYDDQPLAPKAAQPIDRAIQDKVVGRLKKLGFHDAQVLVNKALKKRPKTEQELTKLALAEVEIPDEH